MKFYNLDNQSLVTDFNSIWCVCTHMTGWPQTWKTWKTWKTQGI